nr:MAG TPA: putative transcriptional regulator [Bacteriophage sp.]
MTDTTTNPIKPHDPDGVAGALLISKKTVCALLGISTATLDRWRKDDSTFPKCVQSPNRQKRWKRSDIETFAANLKYES